MRPNFINGILGAAARQAGWRRERPSRRRPSAFTRSQPSSATTSVTDERAEELAREAAELVGEASNDLDRALRESSSDQG